MPPSKQAPGTSWHIRAARVALLSSGLLSAACHDDDHTSTATDGGPHADGGPLAIDGGSRVDGGPLAIDAGLCEQTKATLSAFLAEHSSCTVDSDCTIVGDCCPHADFPVVRSDVSGQARTLQLASCGAGCDGPTYTAICLQGKCAKTTNPMGQWCGARIVGDGGV